jgi:hypothetical protein
LHISLLLQVCEVKFVGLPACRAVEGDEVAVQVFKLQDWFTVYKESSKVKYVVLIACWSMSMLRDNHQRCV